MQTTLHHPTLQTLIETIPIFQKVIPTDVSVALADTEKIIAYYPGKIIDLKIQVGAPLQPGSPNPRNRSTATSKTFTRSQKSSSITPI